MAEQNRKAGSKENIQKIFMQKKTITLQRKMLSANFGACTIIPFFWKLRANKIFKF